MTLTRLLSTVAVAAALSLAVSGCVGPPVTGPATPGGPAPTAPAGETGSPGASEPGAPRVQADSCEWELPRVNADAVTPSGQSGELVSVLIGSWQHTHFDTGSGWESTSNDLRYVFPAEDRMIYCQHVPGITDHAENRAGISLEGALIQPPSPHPGFEVVAWSTDTMLWVNHFDDSRYLLVRR